MRLPQRIFGIRFLLVTFFLLCALGSSVKAQQGCCDSLYNQYRQCYEAGGCQQNHMETLCRDPYPPGQVTYQAYIPCCSVLEPTLFLPGGDCWFSPSATVRKSFKTSAVVEKLVYVRSCSGSYSLMRLSERVVRISERVAQNRGSYDASAAAR